jgi:hypothetical protein
MFAGKTIPLYLESRERSLSPVSQSEEPFELAAPFAGSSSPRESFYVAAAEWKLTVYPVLIHPMEDVPREEAR